MNGIKFNLSGKTAFFKQPDVNSYCYFTYSHIHKLVLLGLLGAIIGLDGKIQQKERIDKGENVDYPEYYEALKDLKVSIVPKMPYWHKKIQIYNNTVGYASREEGCTLNVREQWLENVEWDIYLLQGKVNNEIWDKLKYYLLNSLAEYHIYLGANCHFANINNVKEMILEQIDIEEDNKIDSLFMIENGNIKIGEDLWDDDLDEREYYLKEYMPVSLNGSNLHVTKNLYLTNKEIEFNNTNNIYKHNEKVLYFI